MTTLRRPLVAVFSAALALAAAGLQHGLAAAQAPAGAPAAQGGGHDMSSMQGMPGMAGMPAPGGTTAGGAASAPSAAAAADAGAAEDAMAGEHMEMGLHMKMTAARPRNADDERRAAAIAQAARTAIAKYRDYRVAVADGFIQFAANFKLPMYHFTNYDYARQAQSTFDPARPTSLLYKPLAGGGFELVGAMYTAPRRFDEQHLDERVPLSVTAWHQHVDICLPAKSAYATTDWQKFGFHGSIATASDCQAGGGTFYPVLFGWMVHVYPFEQDPAKVWAH